MVRVVAYVMGLALLVGGGAAVTFGDRFLTGQSAAQAQATATTLRTDERASRGETRATATATPLVAMGTPPTTTPIPGPLVTTPAPAATTTATATAKATKAAPAPVAAGCSGYTGNRLIACNLLPTFGFATSQMSALDPLWNHESGWNHTAKNPSSGAYGIPQALPGNKMATAGSDWLTNPATQITWGLTYIKQRYGSPAGAWSFWQSNGWY